MKKRLHITLYKSYRNIDIFLTLFLCFFLSINLNGQKDTIWLNEFWENESWQYSSLVISTYDANGYLTNTLSQNWDKTSSTWRNNEQSIYTNNSHGSPDMLVIQNWDQISGWKNYRRTIYTYNSLGKALTELVENWTNENWQYYAMKTFTYDGNGYLSTSGWDNGVPTVYTYNPGGTLKEETSGATKINYFYNTSGKRIASEVYHRVDGIWQNYYRSNLTYDGNGYLINTVYQLWHQYTLYDPYSGIWFNDKQMKYVNNLDGTLIQCTTQVSGGGSPWRNFVRETYIISVPTGASEIIKEESFAIYPNPAHDIITIIANKNMHDLTYSFIDLTGKVILKGKLIGESTTIDIHPLINGIYYLQFGGRNQHSYKVLINQ
jgi:hypothetical protein